MRPPLEGPQFALRKTWVDPVPDIEMVQVHYAWSAVGEEPDWDAAESMVLVPDAGQPGLRSAVVDVPRGLPGQAEYALHHFFFVVRGTSRDTTPVVTELITPSEVVYEDHDGRFTHVGVLWGVRPPDEPAPPVPNYTTASMDGLDFGADQAPPDVTGTAAAVFDFVHSRPLPHVFRARVWGPRGFRVSYVVHLVRAGSPDPAEDIEEWDDNGGQQWYLDL